MELGNPTQPALEAVELYRFYHAGDAEVFALRGVSLAVYAGELVAVVGPSGSGKTTFVSCLAGLDEPDGGHVEVGGTRISRRSEAERGRIRANAIGILRQHGNLFEHLTVRQNVAAAQTLAGSPDSAAVDELLERLGLASRASAHPATLSGGEAARAGVAVALANAPSVVIADEPTGEVDRENEDTVLELLTESARLGRCVVVVTHSERLAAAASRIAHLEDGRLTGV